MAVFQNRAEPEQAKEELTWSGEAINACWTNGWKRLEVIGAIVKALEENKAKFDHFVDNLKTADARLFGQKTESRRGVGDQKPCISDGTSNAEER